MVNVLVKPTVCADIPFRNNCSKIASGFNSQEIHVLESIPKKLKRIVVLSVSVLLPFDLFILDDEAEADNDKGALRQQPRHVILDPPGQQGQVHEEESVGE